LSPLSRADTAALVQTLARTAEDDGATAARAEQVWAISEGNPFMVVEAMRSLQEGSMPPGPIPTLYLPARIREVITRRLERLSAQGQELAAVAAVIGRDFEFALLQRASGITEREAAVGVEELVRRRILRGIGERFDFAHDRIREATATGLLAHRRKLLHGQVAAAIEEVYSYRLEPQATALGLHHLHAEAWDKASAYLLQAGRAARLRGAHREAVACLNQALRALEHLPRSRGTSERALDIRIELGWAHAGSVLGERGLVLGHLREAERLAVDLDDQSRLGMVLAALADEWWFLGEFDSAVEAGERALAIGSALGDLTVKVEARSPLGRAHHSLTSARRGACIRRPCET